MNPHIKVFKANKHWNCMGKLEELEFYRERVAYDGQPLGIHVPVEDGQTEYRETNGRVFQERSREVVNKEEFLISLYHFRLMAENQIDQSMPHMNKLRNTRRFLTYVISTLETKDKEQKIMINLWDFL